MYQIDNSTAVASIPASSTAGTSGFFTDGNPATGVPATIMPAEFMNMLMMEVLNVLSAAGVTPSKSSFTQLTTAIRTVNKQSTVLVDTGTAGVYKAVNVPALTSLPASGFVQTVRIVNVNPGAATYAPDGLAAKPIYGLGLQPLQGGELPPGIAVFMYLVQAGVNGGNGAWILLDSLGGALPVAPATQSQHAVQFSQVSGIVGSVRNLRCSVPATSATANIIANEIVVQSNLGGLRYCLPAFNKTINLATTGAGGMDTGTATANGFVGIYAIYNPTTQASALLATMEGGSALASVYIGANMPAGYTASALISVAPISGTAGQFASFLQLDRYVDYLGTSVITGSSAIVTAGAVSSALIPFSATFISGFNQIGSTLASAISQVLYPTSTGSVGGQFNTANVTAGSSQAVPFRLAIALPQTIYRTTNNSAGTPSFTISVKSYEF